MTRAALLLTLLAGSPAFAQASRSIPLGNPLGDAAAAPILATPALDQQTLRIQQAQRAAAARAGLAAAQALALPARTPDSIGPRPRGTYAEPYVPESARPASGPVPTPFTGIHTPWDPRP